MFMKLASSLVLFVSAASAAEIPNPLIDYGQFAHNVFVVGTIRETRRVSEDTFIRLASDPATVILDARSRQKFDLLHVKGAKNLSLPDITAEELARIIPGKDTRILIYCNNNFTNEPEAFPSKTISASLNVYTFNVLYSYGYTNVFELGPLIDINESRLEFEGTRATLTARR